MTYHSLIGKEAPAITLQNFDGEPFTFTPGASGLPTALFFYPASGTYGCTKEACQFRDAIAEKDTFKAGRVQIIGISPDPVEKQKQFVEKEKLTYPVLSDLNKETFKAYGIGRGVFGLLPVARVTFVVDKKGVIRDALDATLNFGAHSKFVEKWLVQLEAEEKPAPAPTAEATATTTAEAPSTA
jgi:peroxiredoxin Q/BCP